MIFTYLEPDVFLDVVSCKRERKNNIFFVFENEKCAPSQSELRKISKGDNVGFDLRANEYVNINFNTDVDIFKAKIIKSGCKWAGLPGTKLELLPRSGISLETPLRIANTPATIEPTYRGDISILLDYKLAYLLSKVIEFTNDTKISGKKYKSIGIFPNKVIIEEGTRLVQANIVLNVFALKINKNIIKGDFNIYYTISKDIYDNWSEIYPSKRGEKGFGSSGLKDIKE